MDLLWLKVRVAIDRLVGVVAKIRDKATRGAGHLILVGVPVKSCGVVTGDGVGSADLQQRQPRHALPDEVLVGGYPCGGDTRCPHKACLSREIVRSGIAGGKLDSVSLVEIVSQLGSGVDTSEIVGGATGEIVKFLIGGVGVGIQMMLAEIPLPSGLSLVREVSVQCLPFGILKVIIDCRTELGEFEVVPIIVSDESRIVLGSGHVGGDVGQIAHAATKPKTRSQE